MQCMFFSIRRLLPGCWNLISMFHCSPLRSPQCHGNAILVAPGEKHINSEKNASFPLRLMEEIRLTTWECKQPNEMNYYLNRWPPDFWTINSTICWYAIWRLYHVPDWTNSAGVTWQLAECTAAWGCIKHLDLSWYITSTQVYQRYII